MAHAISTEMGDRLAREVHQQMHGGPLSLVMLKQVHVDSSLEDCQLCGALQGGVLFPDLVSLDRETLLAAQADHAHWKYGEVEVFRTPAHIGDWEHGVRIIPDDDQPFEVQEQGMYRIGIYQGTTAVGWVDLPPMTAGSTLSTMAVKLGWPE